MVDAGLIVLTSFISPFRAERQMARSLMGVGEFLEVFIDTPLDVAERRDMKGLYAQARSGTLKDFTGIDSPYEAPDEAEITVGLDFRSAEQTAAHIIGVLRERRMLAI